MLPLYSLLLAATLVVTSPWWAWQMVRTGKYREGLGERLGRVPERLLRRPGGIWLHAVSVGEVLAAGRLIDELGSALPGLIVYVSTTTRTGQALARERWGAERVFYFPLDFAFAMRSWLRFLRPSLVVLVESEFWPRMLTECGRARVPVAVVNARVSDRSWPRYHRLRVLWRPLLGSFSLVLAQSETDADRLRALGALGAVAAGNLKYDIRVSSPAPITPILRARLAAETRIVVCGSTLAGEETLLLDALPLGELVTVLAPRHPERFDEVARLLAERGLRFVRRSSLGTGGGQPPAESPGDAALPSATFARRFPPGEVSASSVELAPSVALAPGTVVLLDSVGELASVYSLATLAVLGGGFLWPGGHNPLEPAQFGVPVLMGARYANFRDVVEALLKEQAVVLADASGLAAAIGRLLADPDELRAVGERGRRVFEQQAGATSRAVAALLLLTGTRVTPMRPGDPSASAAGESVPGAGQPGKLQP